MRGIPWKIKPTGNPAEAFSRRGSHGPSPLPLGHHGAITAARKDGQWVARCRVRDRLDWMTPHTWRRTYASILDDKMTFTDRAKADLMGQAKFLKDTYVSCGELHPTPPSFSTPLMTSATSSG